MTPQQKRVLEAARKYDGTCSADWIDGLGVDGNGKISRVPARIEELAEEYGCVFECIGRRHKTKVYRLVSGPEVDRDAAAIGTDPPATPPPVVSGSVSMSPSTQETLFGLPRARGRYGFGQDEQMDAA